MKRKLVLVICSFIFVFLNTKMVLAKEAFYQNSNGVEFTEEEYSFISMFYFDGYQDYMSKEDYNNFISSNIMNKEIKIAESNDDIYMPSALVEHNTGMKNLKLSSACSGSSCEMSITLNWTKMPTARSCDNIGAYLSSTTLISRDKSYYYNDGYELAPQTKKTTGNGLSSTYALSKISNSMNFIEIFKVKNTGRVTASYQHAKTNITLNDSQNFTFSPSGMGGVFAFNYPVNQYYDGMLGVYLDL